MTNFKKVVLHTLGFIIIALGIANIITSKLGASPIDAFNYFLHKITLEISANITLGMVIIGTGLVVTFLTYLLNKKKNMIISAVFLLVVGVFVDMWMLVFNVIPDSFFSIMLIRILLATFGMLLCAFGVSITILTGLPASPYERLMLVINDKIHSISISKIIIEGSFLIFAVILGLITKSLFEQVHVFTLVMTFMMGILVSMFTHLIKNKILKGELVNET